MAIKPTTPGWLTRIAYDRGFSITVKHTCEDRDMRRGYCQRQSGIDTGYEVTVTAADARCNRVYDLDKHREVEEPSCPLGESFVAELKYPHTGNIKDVFFEECDVAGEKLWHYLRTLIETDPISANRDFMRQMHSRQAERVRGNRQQIHDLCHDYTGHRITGKMILDNKTGRTTGARSGMDQFYADDHRGPSKEDLQTAEQFVEEGQVEF